MSMQGGSIHTVAPTTTATALSSITTGLTPGEHGLIGYRMVLGGEVMNVLRWAVGTSRFGGLSRRVRSSRSSRSSVSSAGRGSGRTAGVGVQRGASARERPGGLAIAVEIAVKPHRRSRAGERFVYCYYNGVDKIAHERGFGAVLRCRAPLRRRAGGRSHRHVPAGTAVLVTADHGQVHVGDRVVHPRSELLGRVTMQSGEGRFRWLHCAPPDIEALSTSPRARLGTSPGWSARSRCSTSAGSDRPCRLRFSVASAMWRCVPSSR